MASLTVDAAKREVARLLGTTTTQFANDLKLNENFADVLNYANDEVCRELRIPVRTTTLSNYAAGAITYAAIGGSSTPREDGILQIKWRDVSFDRVLPIYSRNEADVYYPQWEQWDPDDPLFVLWEPGAKTNGLVPRPTPATATYIIRWIKVPDTLPASGNNPVMDGELPSWHKLVPLYTAITILDRDYFGGEAGNSQNVGGNITKQQKLFAQYERELAKAKRDTWPNGAPVRHPYWRR